MFNEFHLRGKSGPKPVDHPVQLRFEQLEERSIPATLTQGQAYAAAYLAQLQIVSGPLTGSYYAHTNFGILPGTGGEGQPPAVYVHEVDSWISVETARMRLQSGLPVRQVLPQAIKAAQAFLNMRTETGEAPPIYWVDAAGTIRGTSRVDAADSAYAGLLRLVGAIHKVAPNNPMVKEFLNAHREAILNVAYRLALLADPEDGLFWTFPDPNASYRMKLLAGNCEDVAAMFAVSGLARNYFHDTNTADYYGSFAINGKQAILSNFYNTGTLGHWYISKDKDGVFGGLSEVPNWNEFDMFLTYAINCNIVAGNSAAAKNIIKFLMQRHPNALTAIPESPGNKARTYTPEFGLALVRVGRRADAKLFAKTVVNAEFPDSTANPDGYFTNRNVGGLIWLTGLLL